MPVKLTDHFTLEEMCHTSHEDLLQENIRLGKEKEANLRAVCVELEKLRAFILQPVIITSGFRSPAVNYICDGSPNSQHLTGDAVDFVVKQFADRKGLEFVFEWCGNHLSYGQLILECPKNVPPWIHLGMKRFGRRPVKMVFNGLTYEVVS